MGIQFSIWTSPLPCVFHSWIYRFILFGFVLMCWTIKNWCIRLSTAKYINEYRTLKNSLCTSFSLNIRLLLILSDLYKLLIYFMRRVAADSEYVLLTSSTKKWTYCSVELQTSFYIIFSLKNFPRFKIPIICIHYHQQTASFKSCHENRHWLFRINHSSLLSSFTHSFLN